MGVRTQGFPFALLRVHPGLFSFSPPGEGKEPVGGVGTCYPWSQKRDLGHPHPHCGLEVSPGPGPPARFRLAETLDS
jgi:hypothetical protein